jgi:hypothetical protein
VQVAQDDLNALALQKLDGLRFSSGFEHAILVAQGPTQSAPHSRVVVND